MVDLEKAMAPHSSTLAWKIPWMEEPGRLRSMGSLKSRARLSDFTFTSHFHTLKKEMATRASVLAWRIPGTGEPGGLPSMGSHRVGHDWSDFAAAADYIAKRMNEPQLHLTAWINFTNIILSKRRQNQKVSSTWFHIYMPICLDIQLYLTLCDPTDCRPLGSSVHGIFQAILEWVATSFSKGSSPPRDRTCIAGKLLTNWATGEVLIPCIQSSKSDKIYLWCLKSL